MDTKCPYCQIGIVCSDNAREMGFMDCCKCGFPLRLPLEDYALIELDDGESIIAGRSCFEKVE